MSQNDAILMHLKTGEHLNPMQALREYGCFRLAARIADLRDSGHRIEAQMVEVSTRGGPKHVADYWMVR